MPITRRQLFAAVAATLAAGAWAQDYSAEGGVALQGYDTVAYFTDGTPVRGDPDIATEWRGARWHFASEENRQRFEADPRAFAPQYGGHCAWAVAQGYTAPIDPAAWRIVDGKLYLNYSKDVQRDWEADIAGNIARADANWQRLGK